MSPEGQAILAALEAVSRERRSRCGTAGLEQAVQQLKAYQHARFQLTYADLLQSDRYRDAARFFLDELYGPADFTERDAQFARVVPKLVKVLPAELLTTVVRLGQLHALSEDLDTCMARELLGRAVDEAAYARAWRLVGRPEDRHLQITLMREIGRALDHYTRLPGLRATLHLMRVPARLAGLSALHRFLERGFDTFHAMHGSGHFLDTIVVREEAFAGRLFDGGA